MRTRIAALLIAALTAAGLACGAASAMAATSHATPSTWFHGAPAAHSAQPDFVYYG